MFFETVSLKDQKPRNGFFRRKVALYNPQTKEILTMIPGFATDWEYFELKGYTQWLRAGAQVQVDRREENKLRGALYSINNSWDRKDKSVATMYDTLKRIMRIAQLNLNGKTTKNAKKK